MNDENFLKKAVAPGEEPPSSPQNEHQRSGLRFARREATKSCRFWRYVLPHRLGAGGATDRWMVVVDPCWLVIRLATSGLANVQSCNGPLKP